MRERGQIISVERRALDSNIGNIGEESEESGTYIIFFLSWLFVGSNLQGFFLYFGEVTDVQFLDLTDCETNCNTYASK